jgi:hypothetical protein
MGFNFYKYLIQDGKMSNMPPISIEKRSTDKYVLYNSQNNRLDNIAGDIYTDETLWRLILWANEQYFIEFDIPDNTVIRVPFPMQDVLNEVNSKIIALKNKG